jgi:hypothetical protein
MKMVDMGRPQPKGKDAVVFGGGEEEGPRVRLDPQRAAKMFGEVPATGSEHRIEGHARVVGSREERPEGGNGGPVHSVEIIIHRMGAEPRGAADNGKSVRDDVSEAAEQVARKDKARPVGRASPAGNRADAEC